MRMREDGVVSHVPIQSPEFRSPSDSRIKAEVSDVDEDDILQRIQALEDACLLHSWNHEEYQRIHHQISDNITSKLSVLSQDNVF